MRGVTKIAFQGFCFASTFVFWSCGDKEGDRHEGERGHDRPMSSGHGGGGPDDCGEYCDRPAPQNFALDLNSVVGLAILEDSSGANLTSFSLDENDDCSIGAIDSNGEGKCGIVESTAVDIPAGAGRGGHDGGGMQARVSAVGFSPTGRVFVLFERSFVYRFVDDPSGDPWSSSSPYTCQLFILENTAQEAFSTEVVAGGLSNLECVTNQHEIPTWRANTVMQFDLDGNLYFPAHVSGNWKDIYYKYNPDTKELTEKVNGNICWRDVEVSPIGSVFYTGTTSTGNDDCSGTSFFRYISQDNKLVEVARDWWDFKYDSRVNPDDASNEIILFYGPDPSPASGVPSWDSACLYEYDPSLESADRSKKIAKCLNHIWDWIDARDFAGYDNNNNGSQTAAVRAEQKARCEMADQIFIGGGGLAQVEQDSNGNVFAAGDLQKKIAGTFKCNLQISKAHCSNFDPDATEGTCPESSDWIEVNAWCDNPSYDNKTDCESNASTWRTDNKWYSDVEAEVCADAEPTNWRIENSFCQQPNSSGGGDPWTETIKGLAWLDPASTTGDEDLWDLMSATNETVIRFWIIKQSGVDNYFYTAFDGDYKLKQAIKSGDTWTQKTLLDKYEVYNLSVDPVDNSQLLFDGLYFTNNAYKFGTINAGASDVESTFEAQTGFTGNVETLIIVPDF
jgi:hypothetical protein